MKSKGILFTIKLMYVVATMLWGGIALSSCQNVERDNPARSVVINYHFATLAEGQQLLMTSCLPIPTRQRYM